MHRTTLFRLLTAGLAGLVLFAPDDGAGSGDGGTGGGDGAAGAGDGAASTGAGTGAADDGAGDDDADKGKAKDTGKTFTQAEVAEMVAKERAKATKTAEAEAAKAAERAKMDEVDRLKAENADKDKAAADRIAAADSRAIAADLKVEAIAAGVNAERTPTFLRLVDITNITVGDDGAPDPTAVKKAVATALKEAPEFKAASGSGGNLGGDMDGQQKKTKATTLEDAITARYANA